MLDMDLLRCSQVLRAHAALKGQERCISHLRHPEAVRASDETVKVLARPRDVRAPADIEKVRDSCRVILFDEAFVYTELQNRAENVDEVVRRTWSIGERALPCEKLGVDEGVIEEGKRLATPGSTHPIEALAVSILSILAVAPPLVARQEVINEPVERPV
jgi:hypothetical protein